MSKSAVQVKDIFTKVAGIGSEWEVDRILEYPDLPPHVRLIEHKGNERTVSVALSVLLDPKQWRLVRKAEI